MLAQVLAAHRIDAHGNPAPIKAADLCASFQRLRSRFPECFSVTPQEAESWLRSRIEQCERADKWPTAIRYLSELIQMHPGACDLYEHRADAFAECGRWTEAESDYAAVIESGCEDLRIYRSLAQASLAMDNSTNYQAICEKVLRKFGTTDAPTRAHLVASVCALAPDAVRDFQRVITLAEKAAALHCAGSSRSVENHLHTLGAAYFRGGRFREALQQLQLGRSRGGGGASYDLLEAMAQFRLNNTAEARRLLENSVRPARATLGRDGTEVLSVSTDWATAVELQLLRREAEALINVR